MRWPSDRRTRLISLVGAAALVVIIASTIGVLFNTNSSPLSAGEQDGLGHGLSTGRQPGSSASASPSAESLAASSAPAVLAKAGYKTVALLGLGGFDTEVTVRNPSKIKWTVVLTMPDETTVVENRSPGAVQVSQKGSIVTVTPATLGESTQFTVRFPALLALGKSITACTIDNRPCDPS